MLRRRISSWGALAPWQGLMERVWTPAMGGTSYGATSRFQSAGAIVFHEARPAKQTEGT